jgi:hypothetical protein
MILRGIFCACGAAELVSVTPGCEAVAAEVGIIVNRGVDPVGLCLDCWTRKYGDLLSKAEFERETARP